MIESKLLDLHLDKCFVVLAGKKKAKKVLEKKLIKNPLTLYDTPMKIVDHERYLGCQLAGTVAESVTETVNKRIAIASKAIYEMRTVIEDCRAEAAGGILVGFQLWQSSILPMVLHGCQTWSAIPRQILKALYNLGLKHIRVSLGIGKQG